MLGIRDYDELNNIVGFTRSEEYQEYFSDMDLSEEDKEKRIDLAQEMENNFLFVLSLIFTMQQYQSVDWAVVQNQFENAYRNSLSGAIDVDEEINSYINQFSYDATETTKNHEDDPYYYSMDRARLISENESNTSWNYSEYQQAISSGKTMKRWVDVRDRRERETHRIVGGTSKPIREPFVVGGSFMNYPKDQTFSPPASETVNCRCTIKYY